jgi:hypothetical protein
MKLAVMLYGYWRWFMRRASGRCFVIGYGEANNGVLMRRC